MIRSDVKRSVPLTNVRPKHKTRGRKMSCIDVYSIPPAYSKAYEKGCLPLGCRSQLVRLHFTRRWSRVSGRTRRRRRSRLRCRLRALFFFITIFDNALQSAGSRQRDGGFVQATACASKSGDHKGEGSRHKMGLGPNGSRRYQELSSEARYELDTAFRLPHLWVGTLGAPDHSGFHYQVRLMCTKTLYRKQNHQSVADVLACP